MSSLKCKYCGGTIRVNDRKCPGCGANTSDVIEEFKENQKKEYNEQVEKNMELVRERMNDFKKGSKFVFVFVGIVFFLVFGTIVFGIVSAVKNHSDISEKINSNSSVVEKKEEKKTYTGSINETVTGETFSVLVSKVETYEMVADFDGYTTGVKKDGFQQVAVYVKITNNSDREEYIFGDITLLADGVQCSESEVVDNTHFRHEKSGKKMDPLATSISSNASVVGWLGYYVDPNAKSLEFRLDDIVITLDNPAYKGE